MASTYRFCLLLLLSGALGLLPACAPTSETARSRSPQGAITRAEIDESNVSGTAYDLISSLRPQWLNRRGGNMLTMVPDEIHVYVDGNRVGTVPDALRFISREDVGRIERLTAREATARYGTDPGHTEGAILIATRR